MTHIAIRLHQFRISSVSATAWTDEHKDEQDTSQYPALQLCWHIGLIKSILCLNPLKGTGLNWLHFAIQV